MKNLFPVLLIIVILFLNFKFENGDTVVDRIIDSKAAEGFVAFITNYKVSDMPDVAKCECGGTGFITHGDGHKTPCPCGPDCSCKKSGDSPLVGDDGKKKDTPSLEEKSHQIKVIKFTANWCGPCKQWNKHELPAINAAGYTAQAGNYEEINVDNNASLASQLGVSSIPCVFVEVDGVFSNGMVYPSSKDVLNTIKEMVK